MKHENKTVSSVDQLVSIGEVSDSYFNWACDALYRQLPVDIHNKAVAIVEKWMTQNRYGGK